MSFFTVTAFCDCAMAFEKRDHSSGNFSVIDGYPKIVSEISPTLPIWIHDMKTRRIQTKYLSLKGAKSKSRFRMNNSRSTTRTFNRLYKCVV